MSGTTTRRRVVPVVLLAAFLVSGGVTQAVTPFIRQDDWAFLLPEGTPGAVPPSYYNASEGRWLNSAWWWLVGQHGTTLTAALTYAVAYALLVAGAWRVLHVAGIRPRPAVDALLGVALYASCVWVQLLYWPGTLTPSVMWGAAALWLLPWATRRRARLAGWLVVGAAGAVLAYPPTGVVLLVLAVVALGEARWRRVGLTVVAWGVGFAAGIGVAYSLNLVLNGHFGLQLAAWRHANPLTSPAALAENVGRWLSTAGELWSAQWWVAVVAVVATAVGWRDPAVRPRLQRLLVALVVACGVDAAQTVATGLVTEARGQLWSWLAAVLPAALLLLPREHGDDPPAPLRSEGTGRGLLRRETVGAALLAVLAVGGVLAWRADLGPHQATRAQYAAIAAAAAAHPEGTPTPTIVVYQDPTVRETRDGRLMASTLFMAVQQERGSVPRWCVGVECRVVGEQADRASVVQLGTASDGSPLVGIVVPRPPDWLS